MWDSALSFKQHQPQVKVATFEAILSDKTAEARQSEGWISKRKMFISAGL